MPSWRNLSWVNPPSEDAAPEKEPELDDSYAFPCTQCAKGFTSQRGLSRHITAVHFAVGEEPALD